MEERDHILNTEIFQIILDNSPENIILLSPEHKVLAFNKVSKDSWKKYLEKDIQIGDDYRDFVVPNRMEIYLENFSKAINGETLVYESEIKLKKVSVWFEFKMNPLLSSSGSLIGITIYVKNIDSQKKAEIELENMAENFEAIIENTDESIVLLDKNYTVLRFNRFASKRLKKSSNKELYIGADFRDYIFPGSEKLFKDTFKKALNGNFEKSEINLTVGEHELWFESKIFPVYNRSGDFLGIAIIALNIKERKLAELALKESEEKYRFITEIVPVILWTADLEGNMDYFNSKMYDYTGKTFEELKDRRWAQIIHPDDLNITLEVLKRALATGKSLQVEHRVLRNDGAYRWHLAKANPLKNKDGKVIKWYGTGIDIHEQKKSSEALKLKNSELAAINKDLDNFIYTASHDLKVPISNIEGLISILSSESLNKKDLNEILNMMNTSVEKFKITVKDLADVTAIQQMREGDVEENEISKIIDEVVLDLDNMINASDVQIKTDLHECPFIEFSRKNIVRILDNLLSNAIKFKSPDRGLEVFIKTEETDENYILSVSDNGLGISKANRQKVFQLFKKAHKQFEGRGLGLYIVKRIIESSGGRIELESEKGKGSTFTVYFKK